MAEEQEDHAYPLSDHSQQEQRSSHHQAGVQLLQKVEELAEAHHGYATLTDLCEMDHDRARLHAHMLRWMMLTRS